MKTTIALIVLCFTLSFATAQRVLTEEERAALIVNSDFKQKCEWAIRDYASYWNDHDGSGLDAAGRTKWRREYQTVRWVVRAEYNDGNLALRFVILAKGMQFNLGASPTDAQIIALFVSGNKFDELASKYFELVTQ